MLYTCHYRSKTLPFFPGNRGRGWGSVRTALLRRASLKKGVSLELSWNRQFYEKGIQSSIQHALKKVKTIASNSRSFNKPPGV